MQPPLLLEFSHFSPSAEPSQTSAQFEETPTVGKWASLTLRLVLRAPQHTPKPLCYSASLLHADFLAELPAQTLHRFRPVAAERRAALDFAKLRLADSLQDNVYFVAV